MVDTGTVELAVRSLLAALGEDVDREDLQATPARAAAAWAELLRGVDEDPVAPISPLPTDEGFGGQIISLREITFTSVCEHHLLPFHGTVSIIYRSSGPVAGLSAFVRSVDVLASRLQLQERLTEQIADAVVAGIAPDGVVVAVTARHGCVSDRGVSRPAARATTVASRGCYAGAAQLSALALLPDVASSH